MKIHKNARERENKTLVDYKQYLQEEPVYDSRQFAEVISLIGLPIERWKKGVELDLDEFLKWWSLNRWKTPGGVGLVFEQGRECDSTILGIGPSFLGLKTTTETYHANGGLIGMERGFSFQYPNSNFHPVFALGEERKFERQWRRYKTIYYKDLDIHKFTIKCESIISGGEGQHCYIGRVLNADYRENFRINNTWAKQIFCLCSDLDSSLWYMNQNKFRKIAKLDLDNNLTKRL